jgi:hypothetical protein
VGEKLTWAKKTGRVSVSADDRGDARSFNLKFQRNWGRVLQ